MFCGKGENLLLLLALLNSAIIDEMGEEKIDLNEDTEIFVHFSFICATYFFHGITYWCSFISFMLTIVTFLSYFIYNANCIYVKLVSGYTCFSSINLLIAFALYRHLDFPGEPLTGSVLTLEQRRIAYSTYSVACYLTIASGVFSTIYLVRFYFQEYQSKLLSESTKPIKNNRTRAKIQLDRT